MDNLPIRRLFVSDFRRIEGTRELSLDAPVVLIHGANGAGKTSVLSALELALTGRIRSMERQSDRYHAHLPFVGQPYATVRADVASNLRRKPFINKPLTVNGARLEGIPAFTDDAAKFYTERCYLDQSSLGRLLELYQHREGSEQSALEKFVNELLGLETLDALRNGLSDANDLRLLKKLASGVDDADREAKSAAVALGDQSALRRKAHEAVTAARAAIKESLARLSHDPAPGITDAELVEFAEAAIRSDTSSTRLASATTLHKELISLGGRISALAERATSQRVQEVRSALATATSNMDEWRIANQASIDSWDSAIKAVGSDPHSEPRTAVEQAMSLVQEELNNDSNTRSRIESIRAELHTEQKALELLHARLADAHEHSSALVEGLTALHTVIDDTNNCPVCDRNFAEISSHSLLTHVDAKLTELSMHREELIGLRNERDKSVARISRAEVELAKLTPQLLPPDRLQLLAQRHASLLELAAQAGDIESARTKGDDLAHRVSELKQAVEDLESTSSEEHYIREELSKYAKRLQVDVPLTFDSFHTALTELLTRAEHETSHLVNSINHHGRLATEISRLESALEQEGELAQSIVELAERKTMWDDRVTEARRRQGVAKEVFTAATKARANIVHRVFTESLNEVWKAVFNRLAPKEQFVPRFGIPRATKKALDINLETVHRDGQASGPPQMMLSAGNLNTAALSLFLALHLAVQPIVPCLVFDDPVQAMDEVHVAQFAGIIRVLAKRNDRQVIIAVHERELFDYLTLELSPAYDGDELITIELGERAEDEDQGIIRHTWAPDSAIAN